MYGPISDRTIDSLNRSIDASLLDNEEKAFSMIVLAEESNKLNDAQPSIKYEKAKTKTTSTTSKTADGGTKTKSRASANSREVDIVTSYSFLAALLAEKSLELNDLLERKEKIIRNNMDNKTINIRVTSEEDKPLYVLNRREREECEDQNVLDNSIPAEFINAIEKLNK